MVNSGKELIAICKEKNISIGEYGLSEEIQLNNKTEEEILENMKNVYAVMKDAAQKGIEKSIKSISGLLDGDAYKLANYFKNKNTICGDVVVKSMARALSCSEVNASMGRIVAAPTAGSCGIIPAAIISVAERFELDEKTVLKGLFASSEIGKIIVKNATVAGAEGGCQAECGSATAMASGAIVEMLGGTPEMALHAAAISLQNIMGLVCDPVAGLVEVPCANRNASGAVNALLCADMIMAGMTSVIPFDEVVEAMYKVGKLMPMQHRETALGGVAVTCTGLRYKKEIFGKE